MIRLYLRAQLQQAVKHWIFRRSLNGDYAIIQLTVSHDLKHFTLAAPSLGRIEIQVPLPNGTVLVALPNLASHRTLRWDRPLHLTLAPNRTQPAQKPSTINDKTQRPSDINAPRYCMSFSQRAERRKKTHRVIVQIDRAFLFTVMSCPGSTYAHQPTSFCVKNKSYLTKPTMGKGHRNWPDEM